uniref:Uncharacterized protein n=1 Tax=Rhizophora mucronata TaxID=61149 RepID=A0A2P2PT26_RHIMU
MEVYGIYSRIGGEILEQDCVQWDGLEILGLLGSISGVLNSLSGISHELCVLLDMWHAMDNFLLGAKNLHGLITSLHL